MKLNSLLNADDLIILSRSKVGLQNCSNTLSSYFNSLMLKINHKKTRKIIFQKSWDNSSIEKSHLQFFQKLINNSRAQQPITSIKIGHVLVF